jgi:superoxide dismutase, Fe-Mn family
MRLQVPSLPYDYGALEPYIDARTMEIHYTKHHAGYVAKLNSLLEGRSELANMSLEDIISDISIVPEEIRQGVRNNGGGYLNHSLFWQIMAPRGGGQPSGMLNDAISNRFGGFGEFRKELTAAAMDRFGSGWAWLCLDKGGKLEIISTPNQDSPIMLGYKPIMGVDVWEHAYYLKYRNRRADYLEAWWNVVNWEKIAEFYAHRNEMLARMGL